MSLNQLRNLLCGVLVALAFGGSHAVAADATQIADSLVAAATAGGNTASYDSATANGDDVVIQGFTMQREGGDERVSVPTVVVSGAEPRDQGGFTAARMTFDNGEMDAEDSTVNWQTGSIDNATVPSPAEIESKARLTPFARLDLGGMNITGDEMPAPVAVDAVGVTVDILPDGTPRDFVLNVDGIDIPEAIFDMEPQQKAVLEALGYSGFNVSVTVEGGYEADSDTLTLRNFAIDTVDVGKLSVTGKFSGVSLSALADDEKAKAIPSNGKLDNLTIRFENAGVVERALDMQAEMMGSSREDVVAQFGAALPFMLNTIGNPPLQEKLATAGQAFLKDPQSVTISAMPSAPVPFAEIMGAAQSNPQTLPDLLVVDVQANN